MKQMTSTAKAATQTRSISQTDSSAGQNAVSIAPPDYGLDFVDSDQVAAMPLQRSSGPPIQAKIQIDQPGDIYEQEANHIAEQVMSMPEPAAQRQAVKKEEEELLQTKSIASLITPFVQRQPEEEEEEELQAKKLPGQTPEVTPSLEALIDMMKGGGWPLPQSERAFFEPRFGYDLKSVRVHSSAEADSLNRELNSSASTSGRDIFFRNGAYAPGSSKGRELLAHELTHIVQQAGGVHREHRMVALRQQSATVSSETGVEQIDVQHTEEQVSTEQTVYFEREKDDYVEHSVADETDAGQNGHLSEWITEAHAVTKSGSDYVVGINKLDLHTKVYVWPENTPGRWDNIANFGQYYGKPYSAAFNMYEGTLRHEKQHAVEAVNAFNAHEPWFRGEVAKIKEPTRAAAEAKYQALFNQLKTRYNASYWANGEVDGHRVEWEYYHEQYEKFTAEPLAYGLVDWAITDADAQKVLRILEDLDNRGAAGFQKMVQYLDNQGFLDRLLDNISYADKRTYKNLIAKIYGRL